MCYSLCIFSFSLVSVLVQLYETLRITFCCKIFLRHFISYLSVYRLMYKSLNVNALDQQLAERKRLEEEEQQRHEAFGEIRSA